MSSFMKGWKCPSCGAEGKILEFCKVCRSAYNAAYREANKERIAARKAACHEANKERIAARKAAYREANKERIAARHAAYREANKERIAYRHAKYNKNNAEKIFENNQCSRIARKNRKALAALAIVGEQIINASMEKLQCQD